MGRVHRFDRAELRPPQKRADGSVRYDAVLSRVGVFEYRTTDGKVRREYRSPEEVGRADSLASLELTPVTDGHPAKPGLAKKCAVGTVGDTVKFDGLYVKASIVVLDDAVNERIARGDVRELSPGYSIDLDETPGVSPEGEAYDVRQTNIIYEHQALVPRGRQGSTVALRADEADAWRADAAVQVEGCWDDVAVTVHSASLSSNDLDRAVRDALTSIEGVTVTTPPKYDSVDAAMDMAGMMRTCADACDTARKSLAAAIARHERHMNGTEATDEKSQQKMMDEMKAALAALDSMGGSMKMDSVDAAIKPGRGWDQGYPPGRAAVRVSTRELSLADLTSKLKAALASLDVVVGLPDSSTDAAASAALAAATPPRTDRADAAGHMEPVMEELQKKLAAALADLAAANTRADAAEAKVKIESARADKAEGDRDAAKDRADKADKARADAIEAAPGLVRARLQLEAQAAAVLGKDFKFDGLDDTAVKAAVVAKLTAKELPADKVKNADYVSARFDAALELAGDAAAANAELREASTPKPGERTDAIPTEADAARAMRERNKALSQNTPTGSN